MRSFILAAAASLIVAAPAAAATITVNHILDPSLINNNIFQDNLTTPFTAMTGDTVIFNLTFTGGQPITVEGDSYLWLLSLTNSGSATIDTSGTWEFLSPSANLVSGPIAFVMQNSFVHLGSSINSADYRLDADPISFSGITQTITLDGLRDYDSDGDGIPDTMSTDPREYYSIALVLGGGRLVQNAVPESATWMMMIAGFGLAGMALRYRRRKLSVSFG
jgi:PEP-CTERM motif